MPKSFSSLSSVFLLLFFFILMFFILRSCIVCAIGICTFLLIVLDAHGRFVHTVNKKQNEQYPKVLLTVQLSLRFEDNPPKLDSASRICFTYFQYKGRNSNESSISVFEFETSPCIQFKLIYTDRATTNPSSLCLLNQSKVVLVLYV